MPSTSKSLGAVLNTKLHLLFAAVASAVVFTATFGVPPGRVPDEPAHYVRAAHVAAGSWMGTHHGDAIGGNVDTNVATFASYIGHDVNFGWSVQDAAAAKSLGWSNIDAFLAFPTTSRNGPMGYIPSAMALATAKRLGLTLWHGFLLARLANGLVAVALGAWAIAMCQRGKLLLLSVLLLPMAMFQMASLSQDACIIAVSALVAAGLTRLHPSGRDHLVVTLGVTFLALARYPLIGLGPLILLPMWHKRAGLGVPRLLMAAAACVAVFGGWLALNANLQGQSRPGVHDTMGPQLQYMVAHPRAVAHVFGDSIRMQSGGWYRMFLGRLGWLDIDLPHRAEVACSLVLLLASAACVLERRATLLWDRALVVASAAATFVLIMIAFYLNWTPVGGVQVEGIQGRYFYSLVLLLPFALPGLPSRVARAPSLRTLQPALCMLCTLLLLAGLAAGARQVARHYALDAAGNPAVRLGQQVASAIVQAPIAESP